MPMEKTFDAATSEAAIAAAWEEADAFRAGANASRAETFCIMIPPPNVTGSLHMGHAFNNTLQDILVRWHRMRGFDTLWQPGQDHAGIATQMVVERQLAEKGQRRTDFTRKEFEDKIWEWKEKSGDTIINQLKRLGASCDWSRNRFTMDAGFHDAVLKVFVEMYHKGLIYRGNRLVNWDPHFETAISDLEVENVEVDRHMWHFKYPLAGGETYEYLEKDEDGVVILREVRDYISIATTRPETMLGDGAVAVHPGDARYAPIVGKLCEIPVGPKEHRRMIPIITDEYPDPDFGSGAVKITGAHDFNDYQVAKRCNIPMYNLMDTKAAMRADGRPYAEEAATARRIASGEEDFTEATIAAMNLVPDDYRGLDRFEARKRVVADITAEGLAVMVRNPDYDSDAVEVPDQIRDSSGESSTSPAPEPGPRPPGFIPFVEHKPIVQPFGDRSKVVIEPYLTDQWYVDTAKIVQPAIDAVRSDETRILPEQDAKVYFHWLENIEPWCISRQLWWGHQVPVWYGPSVLHITAKDGEADVWMFEDPVPFCASTFGEALQMAATYYSDQQAFGFLIAEESADAKGARSLKSGEKGQPIKLWRDPDVLDTWFSSGLWPIGTLGWPEDTPELQKYLPTDVLITGFDIIFFWVARMMMMQLAVVDKIPFHTVYVHALVREVKGNNMSESLGNVMDPLELIDQYGADAVRFTMTAMAAMGRDLRLSTQRIAGYRNFGTKIWNAARFAEMNECRPSADFDPKSVNQTVNKWIIGETARAREAVDAALAAYRFNDAANGLYAHVWGKVCDWYVEFAKPLLQSDDVAVVEETRATMAWTLDQCLLLLHPIMPFITEQLWGDIAAREKMLVHGDWPTYAAGDLADAEADAEMSWIIGLIEDIRSARAELHVPAGAKVPLVELELDAPHRAALECNKMLIARLGRVSEFSAADNAPNGAVSLIVEGGVFCLPLADIIDIKEEISRLEKTMGKLGKELGGLKGKLANEKFLANAPAEVISEQRERLAVTEAEAAKLQAALDRLASFG